MQNWIQINILDTSIESYKQSGTMVYKKSKTSERNKKLICISLAIKETLNYTCNFNMQIVTIPYPYDNYKCEMSKIKKK